jgi:hypothetical protein
MHLAGWVAAGGIAHGHGRPRRRHQSRSSCEYHQILIICGNPPASKGFQKRENLQQELKGFHGISSATIHVYCQIFIQQIAA